MAKQDTPATEVVAPTDPVALWSMITGIAALTIGWFIWLPFGVAAVVLGHLGLVRVKKSGNQGRTYAIVGLVTGYTSMAISIITIVLAALFFGAILLGGVGYGFGGMSGGFPGDMMHP